MGEHVDPTIERRSGIATFTVTDVVDEMEGVVALAEALHAMPEPMMLDPSTVQLPDGTGAVWRWTSPDRRRG